ncbi:PIG-L deacetylase family protein [Isoptericola sp. NPDC019482]|uniref:PIG-L deacetylase family protein n=1 Tax=Isoptericola sp. NPDC019482 TaxID=3154688 RepID=UPI0034746165
MIEMLVPGGSLTVLCLGAHPDDIEIGCGGTLLALSAVREVDAQYVVMTGDPARQVEAKQAAESFLPGAMVEFGGFPDGRLPACWNEAKDFLESVARRTPRPDVVFSPRRDDAHQDHHAVAALVPTVWRNALVLEYEIPKWDGDLGGVNLYVPLDEAEVERKLALLDASFPSQVTRDWWDRETFTALLRLRGVESRSRYAEGFVARKVLLGLGADRRPGPLRGGEGH